MRGPSCARTWEAEAVEDGQLSHADRASFERHATICRSCAREVMALASLRRAMREVALSDPTALNLRRTRAGLLQRAHALRTRDQPRTRRVWVVACALAMAAVLVWVVGGRVGPWRSTRTLLAVQVAGPTFDVVDVAGAAVTSRKEGGVTRAVLSDGIAAFHVEQVGAGLRFLVTLPDGEIEVRGTRFVVDVRGGRTQRVEVTEGVVVLRLRGDGERQLTAGDRWTAPSMDSKAEAPREERAAPPRPSLDLFPRVLPVLAASGRRGPDPAPDPSLSETARPDAGMAASDRFAAGVAAFRLAAYAQADLLLASFSRDFPGDARTEDASFLRAVACSRLGDADGAASLARAYLARFPRGLRRREAEDLVRANRGGNTP